MEDPLSPQHTPNPAPTPSRPSPGFSALPRSHMRTVDKQQHAGQNMRQSRAQVEERRGGAGQEVKEQAQDSPLAWTGPAAPQIMGGVKLARTPIGKSAGSKTGLCFRLQSKACFTLRFATFQGFAMMVTRFGSVLGTGQFNICLLRCKGTALASTNLKAHCSICSKCNQCRAGETPPGGPKLARTPIGTPRQAQPGSSKLDASPAHMPRTAAKAWAQASEVGARSEARTGRQLARTPIGLASAHKPALLASYMADAQGTPGGLLQVYSHSVLSCMQEDVAYHRCTALGHSIRPEQLPVHRR